MSAKKLIYVVDHDSEFQTTCIEQLSDQYEVSGFNEAADLVNALETNPAPQLIISDQEMPGIKGLDLIRLLKKNELDVPVVLISGFLDDAQRVQALEAGTFRILEKPVSMKSLQQCVFDAFHVSEESMDPLTIGAEAIEITQLGLQILSLYKDRALDAERVLKELGLLPSTVEAQLDRILNLGKLERTFQKRRERLLRLYNDEATVDDLVTSTVRKPAA
jgi:FixJ family two-component response regulator